ncbi:MAG TPA: PRC-barrel domain-containing protein [Lacipirellulaceae bacterium]|nr:PRC-barrel domain-containing protein [Lacipirellulaceae bacterium]
MATQTQARETAGLIGSDKVDGTNVYGTGDEKIGSIDRVMVGKKDGKVAYAVLSFGGFLGMGDDHYPIPWSQLTYDTRLGGYRTNISREQLEGAPKYSGDSWDWDDRDRGRQVYDYYGSTWVGY